MQTDTFCNIHQNYYYIVDFRKATENGQQTSFCKDDLYGNNAYYSMQKIEMSRSDAVNEMR